MTAAQLARDLRALADELGDLEDAERQAAELIASAAARGAPRRSGRLAGSVEATSGQVLVTAPYGRVIHDGWARRGIRARPFLTDAADRADWSAPYVDHVTQVLDQLHNHY